MRLPIFPRQRLNSHVTNTADLSARDVAQSVAVAAIPLTVLQTTTTPNGFTSPARGWNSFGNQAINPAFTLNQANVTAQCDVLSSTLASGNYTYCGLDSNWSVGSNGDDNGRIIPDGELFPDLVGLADHLHSNGLELGVYVVPGAFVNDENKTILGTDGITIGSVCFGGNGLSRCDFDYGMDGVQQWHNSVIDLFSSWGVDFIKLDYVTPGSPYNNVGLSANTSGSAIAYHNAITRPGRPNPRPMRLDLSWKLSLNESFYDIWASTSDSLRTDTDINNYGMDPPQPFIAWATVQRAIERYRNYVSTIVRRNPQNTGGTETLTIYPDLDSAYVGNAQWLTGVTDEQRRSIMSHWIGAASNLIIGSDLTQLDGLGIGLLTDKDAMGVADFTAHYPMQPRNPGTGLDSAQQLQAWIAGPATAASGASDGTQWAQGDAVVLLANYGPDEGQGNFNTTLGGEQYVAAAFADLGISGSFQIMDVWNKTTWGPESLGVNATLGEGESRLLWLRKVGS